MDLLNSGQKLSISIQKAESIVEICCTITNILEDRLVVELPPYFMRYIEFLDVGCPLTVKVFSKMGTIDFNTVVINSPFEDEFALELDYNAMRFTPNEEIPVITEVAMINMKSDYEWVQNKTFEIATEYLKFYSSIKYEIDKTFDCELILPKNYGTLYFKGTVIEIDPIYDNEYKISYSNMNEKDRQSLLYYMYMFDNNSI